MVQATQATSLEEMVKEELEELKEAGVAKKSIANPVSKLSQLDLNDVSILFPPPETKEDLQHLISMGDLNDMAKNAVWTDTVFASFTRIMTGNASKVGTHQIGFPSAAFKQKATWHIAGIRVDPSAPGTSKEIIAKFGASPQIRLILQPVTVENNRAIVHDFAAHLIFNFNSKVTPPLKGCQLPISVPDKVAFTGILNDLLALKTKLAMGKMGNTVISTAGKPLNVHPGLQHAKTVKAVRDELKAFLSKHVTDKRLFAMAAMGLQKGNIQPWIFLSMAKEKGSFVAVQSPALPFGSQAEVFTAAPSVEPKPATNNNNPITCNLAIPPEQRNGVSTATLFKQASMGRQNQKEAKKVTDIIADPTKSHFFNTDCVSCHSTTNDAIVQLTPAMRGSLKDIAPAVLPNDQYNVHNFGWFPLADPVKASIGRRTATETRSVVNFIKKEYGDK
jgi:hypothetical protein